MSDERSNAIKGFADGARYQGARPGYPGEAVRAMVTTMRLREARLVVDVGAGTGLFTRELVPYCANIVAVEPSAGMRHEFEQQHLGVEVLAGTGESLPFADHSVDAVTVAQAFHWFDPWVALAEMKRILVPGGHLGLIWNERDESVEWVDAMSRAMLWDKRQPYRVGMDFVPVLEEGGLVEIEVGHFRHNQLVDRATLLQRVLTTSYVSVMTEPEQRRILDDVAGVIEGFPETFELPYTTTTYCARTPGA